MNNYGEREQAYRQMSSAQEEARRQENKLALLEAESALSSALDTVRRALSRDRADGIGAAVSGNTMGLNVKAAEKAQ